MFVSKKLNRVNTDIKESTLQVRIRIELCFDICIDVVLIISFIQLCSDRRRNCINNFESKLTCEENRNFLTILQEFHEPQNAILRVL